MGRSVGIDMADIEEVRESVRVHGERYLERVYTDAERRECGASPRRLARCFAAKEAAMKALACRERLPWHSIAISRDPAGRPSVVLSGPAADRAHELVVTRMAVSVSDAAGHAIAVVLATSGG